MSKRVLGIAIALVLAAIGTVLLVSYVQGAEERAQAGEELVEVYVVDTLIRAGSSGENVIESVRVEEVPEKVRPDGAVDNLQTLSGSVASVDLLPGEQLVTSRFIERSEFVNREAGVVVPDGLVEITVQLSPERAVGDLISVGELVSVLASFDPFDIQEQPVVEFDGDEVALPDELESETEQLQTPNITEILLQKVLVTAIQQGSTDNFGSDEDAEQDRLTTTPQTNLLVTLAVSPEDAERVIFTAEFGRVWLASERPDVPGVDTEGITRDNVFEN